MQPLRHLGHLALVHCSAPFHPSSSLIHPAVQIDTKIFHALLLYSSAKVHPLGLDPSDTSPCSSMYGGLVFNYFSCGFMHLVSLASANCFTLGGELNLT
jgi:hypothetical protein